MTKEKRRSFFLVDPDVTKVGDTFEIIENDICRECRYFKICFGDKKAGLIYRVKRIFRPKEEIFCKLIEKKVILAEVEESPVKLSIASTNLVVDVPLSYMPIKCAEKYCPYIKYCVYNGNNLGPKIIINRIIDRLDCPIGLDLFLVEASPLP